jgi:hypothetical protein
MYAKRPTRLTFCLLWFLSASPYDTLTSGTPTLSNRTSLPMLSSHSGTIFIMDHFGHGEIGTWENLTDEEFEVKCLMEMARIDEENPDLDGGFTDNVLLPRILKKDPVFRARYEAAVERQLARANHQQLPQSEQEPLTPVGLETEGSFTHPPLVHESHSVTDTGISDLGSGREGDHEMFGTSYRTNVRDSSYQSPTNALSKHTLATLSALGARGEPYGEGHGTLPIMGEMGSIPQPFTSLPQGFTSTTVQTQDTASWIHGQEHSMYDTLASGNILLSSTLGYFPPGHNASEISQRPVLRYSEYSYDSSAPKAQSQHSMPTLTSPFTIGPSTESHVAQPQINTSDYPMSSPTRSLAAPLTNTPQAFHSPPTAPESYHERSNPPLSSAGPQVEPSNYRLIAPSTRLRTFRTPITERELAKVRKGYEIGVFTTYGTFRNPGTFINKLVRIVDLSREEARECRESRYKSSGARLSRLPTEDESRRCEKKCPREEGWVDELGRRRFFDSNDENQDVNHDEEGNTSFQPRPPFTPGTLRNMTERELWVVRPGYTMGRYTSHNRFTEGQDKRLGNRKINDKGFEHKLFRRIRMYSWEELDNLDEWRTQTAHLSWAEKEELLAELGFVEVGFVDEDGVRQFDEVESDNENSNMGLQAEPEGTLVDEGTKQGVEVTECMVPSEGNDALMRVI